MSNRGRHKKGFYEAIKKVDNPQAKEQILIDLQSHAYRSIINDDLKGLRLKINIPKDGDLYNIFADNYNQHIGMPIRPQEDIYISYIVPRKLKSIKKMKKNSTRIKKEMLKMCKNGWICKNDAQTKKCICDFESAIRESFIIVRRSLKKEAYDNLPNQIQLEDGFNISSDKYYVKSDRDDLIYIQNPEMRVSETEKKFVQYQISDRIFFIVRQI